MKIGEVIDFCIPPGSQHTQSLYLLCLLADYGPLEDGAIKGGPYNNRRALTIHEIKPMLEVYAKQITEMIRVWPNVKNFHHPIRHEMLELIARFIHRQKKTEITYPEEIGMQTEVSFLDLSNIVQTQMKEILIWICRNQ